MIKSSSSDNFLFLQTWSLETALRGEGRGGGLGCVMRYLGKGHARGGIHFNVNNKTVYPLQDGAWPHVKLCNSSCSLATHMGISSEHSNTEINVLPDWFSGIKHYSGRLICISDFTAYTWKNHSALLLIYAQPWLTLNLNLKPKTKCLVNKIIL